MNSFWQGLRYGARMLRTQPGFTLIVVLTLALGIGANAAIFTVVRGVLLKPLVNRDEERLIYVRQSAPGIGADNTAFSVPEIQDLRAGVKTLNAFGEFSTIGFTLLGLAEPREVQAGVVNGNYFVSFLQPSIDATEFAYFGFTVSFRQQCMIVPGNHALLPKAYKVSAIKEMQSEGKPKIHVLYFDELPEAGFVTAVTVGLSNANHPDWKLAAPELMITMEGNDRSWGLGIAYFASAFFGVKRFSYGDIFKIDTPISPESPMNAFLAFAPPFSTAADFTFELSDRKIILAGMYPIYDEEIAYDDKIGLKDFWHADGFEIDNPKRKPIKAVQ